MSKKHAEAERPVPEQEIIEPGTENAVMAALEEWEQRLIQIDPSVGDREYGRVRERLERLAHGISHRLTNANRNKCASCSRPLPARGPADTIAVADPSTATGWKNLMVCSTICGDKLRQKVHAEGLKHFAQA